MGYEGVKYKLLRHGNEPPQHNWLTELQRWCVIFHEEKMAPYYKGGSHGNLSFRVKEGAASFIITAASSSLVESTSNEMFYHVHEVDIEHSIVYASGLPDKQPSSEAMLHSALYQKRPEIMAILHGHCKEITNNATKLGIVTTRQFVESGTDEIIESVAEVLGPQNFIEIKDHGFISLGKTVSSAGELALQMMQKARSIA